MMHIHEEAEAFLSPQHALATLRKQIAFIIQQISMLYQSYDDFLGQHEKGLNKTSLVF